MARTRTLSASQIVPASLAKVFAFFSRPENLGRIMPPEFGIVIRGADRAMRAGQVIDYTVRPLLGIPTPWRARIDAYDPPHAFVDVQLRGPYRRWEHRHMFSAVENGTRIDDEIVYELPFGRFGDALHDRLVRPVLERMFRYRAAAIHAIFAPAGVADPPLTVAVAGGTGFVGGAIAAELRRRGHRLVVLSHRGQAARGPLPDDVEIRPADIAAPATLGPALAGVDALVVALAFPNYPMENPRRRATFMDVDAAGTERLVAAAREAGARRIVYVSGAGAAPDAKRAWFRAKWRAEEAVRRSGIAHTIIRPTWIYGPRDAALNRFLAFARTLPFVPLTNRGRQLMAPVFIDDVARLAADSLTMDAAVDQVFEVGGPETMPMHEVIRVALAMAGTPRPILPGPTLLLKLAAWPLSFLPRPPLTPSAVDFINQPATVDVRPLLERMPRRLTPLDEGLATYLGPAPDRELRFGRAA
jgi:NADH dehydrogenase